VRASLPRGTPLLLWLALAATLPLPFWLVERGWVPALRLALLAAVLVGLRLAEGGSGVVDLLAGLALGQALLAAALLALLARELARGLARLPARAAPVALLLLVVALFGTAASFDLYRTPFRTQALRGSLLDLLE
jgi:hypothetical protein